MSENHDYPCDYPCNFFGSFANNPFAVLDKNLFPKEKNSQNKAITVKKSADTKKGKKILVLSAKKLKKEQSKAEDIIKTEETDEAFTLAMHGVKPLIGKGRDIPASPVKKVKNVTDADYADLIEDKFKFSLQYGREYVEGHVLGLDPITVGKLQAGKLSPQAHLDLHGLTVAEAWISLVNFIRSAYMSNKRIVLIVSGRGINSPNGTSILREKVQTWLTKEPFRRVALAFCTARASDGGAGAFYVLLRKFRKGQGKVHWDKLPLDSDLFMT